MRIIYNAKYPIHLLILNQICLYFINCLSEFKLEKHERHAYILLRGRTVKKKTSRSVSVVYIGLKYLSTPQVHCLDISTTSHMTL